MKMLTVCLFAILQLFCLAQEEKTIKGFSIGVTPLNLLEPVTNTFELVGEYLLNEKYSVELKIGLPVGQYFNPIGKKAYWSYMHESGNCYELKLGVKKFFISKSLRKKRNQLYLNLEMSYLKNNFTNTNDWYTKDNKYSFYEEAKVKRSAVGLGFALGKKYNFSKRFGLDVSTGFGLRNVKHVYKTQNEYENEPYSSKDTLPFVPQPENLKYEGNKIKAYLIYSIRLMYRLSKN